MRRRRTIRTTSRDSALPVSAAQAWAVIASGALGRQWYVDAAPWVVRGGIDRLVGGAGRRWPVPGTPLLTTGDRVGFWRVDLADHDERHLVLSADVRAPGEVTLTTRVDPALPEGCRLHQSVTLQPAGVLGAVYLVSDLGAREAVMELAHRRLVADVLATRQD